MPIRDVRPPAGEALACVIESRKPVAVLRLAGRLDLASVVDLRVILHKTLTDQPSAIVIDLAGMTVSDDIVLTVFSAFARTAARWPTCPVLLCAPAPAVLAMLNRMGVSRALPMYSRRDAAVEAASTLVPSRRYLRRLWPTATAAAAAREVVVAVCRAWRLDALIEDAELIVTELVSNAVRHASGDIELLVVVRDHFLHVSIRDGNTERPRMILPDPETGEGGRGLILLDAIASGWGSTPMPDGKVVWATLRIR